MSEMKMSDYFFNGSIDSDDGCLIENGFKISRGMCKYKASAISHAVSSHDPLVEENQRLTAIATKHATVNDERYELLEKQKSDIEKMLDQLFQHEKVDGWLVCKMNDMLDDVNHQLEKSRIEAEKGDGICD